MEKTNKQTNKNLSEVESATVGAAAGAKFVQVAAAMVGHDHHETVNVGEHVREKQVPNRMLKKQ
jgi:biotin carboxyl carrier protein